MPKCSITSHFQAPQNQLAQVRISSYSSQNPYVKGETGTAGPVI